MSPKSTSCRYNVTFWNYVENGALYHRWQLPITPLATKNTCTSSSSLGVAGNLWLIVALRQKRLKETISLLFISPRWTNAAGAINN
jgi:hypothetical protein